MLADTPNPTSIQIRGPNIVGVNGSFLNHKRRTPPQRADFSLLHFSSISTSFLSILFFTFEISLPNLHSHGETSAYVQCGVHLPANAIIQSSR